tara:strand:- start:729 stop:1262 length:534 start_codon:yes stop_codon:yes gene_type:complete
MSRRSFDDGHQNQAHNSGFNLDFNEMHNLFHGQREVISDVARDEGISFDEAAGFVPDAIAEVDADNLENYEANDLGDLVDPQNDTYEEEGTHGLALALGTVGKAAAKGYMAARSNPKTGPMVKAGEAAVKEKGKEIVGQAIAKGKEKWGAGSQNSELKGKGGAGLASPASESDDPLA